MKSAIRPSAIKHTAKGSRGRCCVCAVNGVHKFFDSHLNGPACDDCVGPLLKAETVLSYETKKRQTTQANHRR
jgi:hypothetical protein